MVTVMISTRLDENLLAEIDTFAAAKDKTRSDAIGSLLQVGLAAQRDFNDRLPGWDAKEIARIAVDYYGGMATLFETHNWPERGARMIPSVQRRVTDHYGKVKDFIEFHASQTPEEFRKALPEKTTQPPSGEEQMASWPGRTSSQRSFMRDLVRKHGMNKDVVCAAYAKAERAGVIKRKNNNSNQSPEKYADALWRDGENKGWFLG